MFDALFGKFAIQTSIKTPYSDDALLCIFALESSTNFRFQPDGFHFFLKEFPFPSIFKSDTILQRCTAVLESKAKSVSRSVPVRQL